MDPTKLIESVNLFIEETLKELELTQDDFDEILYDD